MLFYYKMLTKIMETCNVKVKEVDSSMKDKLIVNLSAKSTNTTHREIKLSMENESFIGKNKVPKFTSNNHRPRHMQNSKPKVFTKRPELNKEANKMDQSDNDQLKLKLSKFFPNNYNTSSNEESRFSNNPEPCLRNLRNVQTQSEIEHYTQQLYQHIVSDAQQQNNPGRFSSNMSDRYNQNPFNINSSFQQLPSQNPHPPSLLNLRLKDPRPPSNKYYSKKK